MHYMWFVQTKDFDKLAFYRDKQDKVSPLESIEDFDQGKNWSLDISDEDAKDFYKVDPTEDSFILIPKSDVIRIWSEPTQGPKKVNIKKFGDL